MQVGLLFGVVKRIPISLIMAVFIISLSLVVTWVPERGPVSNHAGVMAGKTREREQQINDCDAWAGMSFKEKKGHYRGDPERWARCLCEGEGCALDRIYLTGRVSR